MTIREAVAQRILTLCDEQNITINMLSTRAGVTQSTVDSIIKGKSKNPGICTIKKLCDASNISIPDFFNHPLFCDLELDLN